MGGVLELSKQAYNAAVISNRACGVAVAEQ